MTYTIGTHVRTVHDLAAVQGAVIGYATILRPGMQGATTLVLIEPDGDIRAHDHRGDPDDWFPVTVFPAHPDSLEPAPV